MKYIYVGKIKDIFATLLACAIFSTCFLLFVVKFAEIACLETTPAVKEVAANIGNK